MYYIEDKHPKLHDLVKYVANNFNYAQKWRDLGIRLHLHPVQLDDIQNNSHGRTSSQYCTSMFQKWLEMTPNASWDQVISAINELTPISEMAYTGMNL